jgi:serine phosphatase RsbU (regulator of sigma subunit)
MGGAFQQSQTTPTIIGTEQYNHRMKISKLVSPWEAGLIGACFLVAAAHFAPEGFTLAEPIAAALLAVAVLVWYQQRLLGRGGDEYAKLQMAAFAVQVLWLTLLYNMAAGLLQLSEVTLAPVSALLLAVGAAALAAAVLVSLDLALVRKASQFWRLAFIFATTVAVTQAGASEPAAALVPLGFTGLLLGLLAPMGWLITMEGRQRISVLMGGVLAIVPLLAATVVFISRTGSIDTAAAPLGILELFIGGGSLFALTFVSMLLIRAVQALSGARQYERKVQELDAVYDFGLTTTSALDDQEFQTAVLRSLRQIGSPDVVALVEPGKDRYVSFSLLRIDATGEHIYRHQARASWADLSIRFGDRRPLVISDHSRGAASPLPRIWEPLAGSSVIIPVLDPGGSPRALLIAGKHDAHAFKTAEVRSLSGFGNQVGLAMEHARLLVELVESERRKNELDFARQMQMDLLPQHPPDVEGLDIADRSNPATEVGGDYFDYLDLPSGNLGVVFGDVAGHGMTAGLIMAMAKSAVHTQVRADGRPGQLLPRLGEVLLEMTAPNQYMTMVFTELDVEGRSLRYLNAGHHFPLHYRAATGEIEFLESTGPPLGLLPKPPGEAQDREWDPGDVLAFYSDGLVEAFNENDQEFGINRLGEFIAARSEQPAATIVEEAYSAVRRFTGDLPWHDDATLVIVRLLALGVDAAAVRAE